MDEQLDSLKQAIHYFGGDAARRAGHNEIGLGHLLIGVVQDQNGLGARLLRELKLAPEAAIDAAKTVDDERETRPTGTEFTRPATNAIYLAKQEAANERRTKVGTEHLLLGLITEPTGAIRELLHDFGIDEEQVRDAIAVVRQAELRSLDEKRPTRDPLAGSRVLTEFGEDLVRASKEGRLPAMIGRKDELEQVIETLNRSEKNSPVLIGESGVGKTQIAYGLAHYLAQDPELLPIPFQNKRLVRFNMGKFIANTGGAPQAVQMVLDHMVAEIKKLGNVILFIDEIHILASTPTALQALKPYVTDPDVPIIAATTSDEYRKFIETDHALSARFQPWVIKPAVDPELTLIVKSRVAEMEAKCHAHLTDAAIEKAVELGNRYFADLVQPAATIAIVDQALSRADLAAQTPTPELLDLHAKVLRAEKAVAEVDTRDLPAKHRALDRYETAALKYGIARKEWQRALEQNPAEVNENDVARVVAELRNIDPDTLVQGDRERIRAMDSKLRSRVFSQDHAIDTVSRAIRRNKFGLRKGKKTPQGSFLFLGPTGVGKTELARALAYALMGNENSMLRLDMSEYMEPHSVSRLFGSPPGYIGYDDAPQLTEPIRRNPYQVILIDEFEKAHPDVQNVFLQIMDDGRLTDAQGHTVDFQHTYLIFTGNIGNTANAPKRHHLGFGDRDDQKLVEATREYTKEQLKERLRPEFINRLTDIAFFDPLDVQGANQIMEREINKSVVALAEAHKLKLEVGDEVRSAIMAAALLDHGAANGQYNGRPIERTVVNYVDDTIADYLAEHEPQRGKTLYVSLDEAGAPRITQKPTRRVTVECVDPETTVELTGTRALAESVLN